MKKKGFTLIELLVVIAIIAMLLAILMPALNKVKRLAQRLVCTTNLKGLATALVVYSNDYYDQYPVQGGTGNYTWGTRFPSYAIADHDWDAGSGLLTVGASLYLLVRETDVSLKSFVCRSSDQKPYEGQVHSGAPDPDVEIVELWDFGHETAVNGTGPRNCVSYAYHLPYVVGNNSAIPATSVSPSGMALMADRNPWFDEDLGTTGATAENFSDNINLLPIGGDWEPGSTLQKYQIQASNAYPHNREGQNISFNDGHAEFSRRPDVGYANDNIYTFQTTSYSTVDDNRRVGYSPRATNKGLVRNSRDSWLVNDVDAE